MKTKEQLIKVFEEVIEDIISREYECKDNYIEFPETDRLIYESKMYKFIQKGSNKSKFQTPPKIYVQNIDTFEKIFKICLTGKNRRIFCEKTLQEFIR